MKSHKIPNSSNKKTNVKHPFKKTNPSKNHMIPCNSIHKIHMIPSSLASFHFWLVVSPPLKNMKVNWDDDIPNWMKKTIMFQSPPTRFNSDSYLWIIFSCLLYYISHIYQHSISTYQQSPSKYTIKVHQYIIYPYIIIIYKYPTYTNKIHPESIYPKKPDLSWHPRRGHGSRWPLCRPSAAARWKRTGTDLRGAAVSGESYHGRPWWL